MFPDSLQRLVTHYLTEAYLFRLGFRRGPALYYAKTACHSRQQELKFDAIEDANLLGLGVSSFGYLGHTQYYNHCVIDDYLQAVHHRRLPVWRGVTLDADEQARRTAMFGLRSAGIDDGRFAVRFGRRPGELFPELERFRQLGLLDHHGESGVPRTQVCTAWMAWRRAWRALRCSPGSGKPTQPSTTTGAAPWSSTTTRPWGGVARAFPRL